MGASPQQRSKPAQSPALIPTPARPVAVREPTEFQKLLADLFADLVTRGGNIADAEEVLRGLLSHHYKQMYYRDGPINTERRAEGIDEFIKQHLDKWYAKLSFAWPARGVPDAPRSDPKTVATRIRMNVRNELRERFERFVSQCEPEEVWLLDKVFQSWETNFVHSNQPDETGDIAIAGAMARVLGRAEHYITVPARHWNLVVDYLRLLDGQECSKD